MVGGISNGDVPATPEVADLVQEVKNQVVGRLNSKVDLFQAVSYRTQIVAGVNYFVKV